MLANTPPKLIPALLTSSPEDLNAKFELVTSRFNRVQIDLVDEFFEEKTTVGPEKLTGFPEVELDLHLLVKTPLAYLVRYRPDQVGRLVAQIEPMTTEEQFDFCLQGLEKGFKVGLAVDLPTELDQLAPETLTLVDQVLVMGIEAGRQGREFETKALAKISQLRSWQQTQGHTFTIGVDGGIRPNLVKSLIEAGAQELFVGSFLLKAKDFNRAADELERAVKEASGS